MAFVTAVHVTSTWFVLAAVAVTLAGTPGRVPTVSCAVAAWTADGALPMTVNALELVGVAALALSVSVDDELAVTVGGVNPGVAAPFDEYTLNAFAQSADDDPSICPSQFANASYTFNWSVFAPPTKYAFNGVGNTSSNTSQARFQTGETGQLTLHVSAVGNKSNVLARRTR